MLEEIMFLLPEQKWDSKMWEAVLAVAQESTDSTLATTETSSWNWSSFMSACLELSESTSPKQRS
jgi:hypothetical protein